MPDRQLGWCSQSHPYCAATIQIVQRNQNKQGKWHYRVLVSNLPDEVLFPLAGLPIPQHCSQLDRMLAIAYAYDLRGGAVETSFRNSKQGLHIIKRNKRSFCGQEMLILLAHLAYNLLIWFRSKLAQSVPSWLSFGILRLIRDAFHISGFVEIDHHNRILSIAFNRSHSLSNNFLLAFSRFKPIDLCLLLRKI